MKPDDGIMPRWTYCIAGPNRTHTTPGRKVGTGREMTKINADARELAISVDKGRLYGRFLRDLMKKCRWRIALRRMGQMQGPGDQRMVDDALTIFTSNHEAATRSSKDRVTICLQSIPPRVFIRHVLRTKGSLEIYFVSVKGHGRVLKVMVNDETANTIK
nr:hypothetical protein CFP56_36490 [Quercus suber]